MSEQTPRINAPLIDKFRNTTVRIVGKVVDVKEDTAVVDAQGQIQLQLQRDDRLVRGHGVELVGKVLPHNHGFVVKVLTSWDLGENVDYGVAAAVVEVTHRYKELFYDGAAV